MGARSKRIKRLTVKQHKFVKQVVNHPDKTLTECARAVGYAQPTNEMVRLMKNPDVRSEFQRLMALNPKLENKALLDKLAEGMEATKPDPCGPGEIKDFAVQHKYLQTALQLTGALDNRERDNAQPSIMVNLIGHLEKQGGIIGETGEIISTTIEKQRSADDTSTI